MDLSYSTSEKGLWILDQAGVVGVGVLIEPWLWFHVQHLTKYPMT